MTFTFDATQVAPAEARDYTPIPAGKYLASISESTVGPMKSGNGTLMKLTFDILDGQFKGRKIFSNLCVEHSNPDTQRIAQQQLSALCHAVNVLRLQDVSMLNHKPVNILVKVRPAKGDYAASNDIAGFESAMGGSPVPQQFTQHAAPAANQAPPAAASSAPWAKRAA